MEDTVVDDPEFVRLKEENQREIDLLSLELLSNSKQYKRYISKNRPEEQLKLEEDARRLSIYKPRVAGLFMELLEEYENPEPASLICNPELQLIFKECVNKMIQHIEWTDCNFSSRREKENEYGDGDDEDMLFSHAYKPQASKSKRRETEMADPFSYWGATIRKSSI
jgi:hypothetical protein